MHKESTPKQKNPVGRPSKIDTIDLIQLEKLAYLGATDKEIADFFDISESTLNLYKAKPEFSESLKRGKDMADSKVVRSLYERACGYTHPEEKVFQHMGEIIIHDTVKQYPPDTSSMIFWLKNRQPAKWRDKTEVEETHIFAKMPSITIDGKEAEFDVGD